MNILPTIGSKDSNFYHDPQNLAIDYSDIELGEANNTETAEQESHHPFRFGYHTLLSFVRSITAPNNE